MVMTIYIGDLIPDWAYEEVKGVVDTDYFQDTAHIYKLTRLPDGKGGLLPATRVKIANSVPCSMRKAKPGEEARVADSQAETVTYRFGFPLGFAWLEGGHTLIAVDMEIDHIPKKPTMPPRTYAVSEQETPKTYTTEQVVLAVKR